MSKFARSFFVLVVLFAACTQAAPDDTRPDDSLARARQFLRALYPGLHPHMSVTIYAHNRLGDGDDMGMFGMELSEPDHPPEGIPGVISMRPGDTPPLPVAKPSLCGKGCECKNPVLNAEFGFNNEKADHRLFMAWMGGPFVSCRLDKLLNEVKRHPQWTRGRILAELKTAGATFGPDHEAEFLRALPIEKLKLFVGEIQLTSTEFQVPELTWLVRTKWHSRDGRMEADANFSFEPFEGKLISYYAGLAPHQTPEK